MYLTPVSIVTDNVFLQIYPLSDQYWQEELQRESKLPCCHWWTGVAWRDWWKHLSQYWRSKFRASRQGISPKHASYTPTFILRSFDLSHRECYTLSVCRSVSLSRWLISSPALFLALLEHFCRPDQSGCNMLRQYIFASVVPQPGAAPEPLWVQQLQSSGTQHRFWYFWNLCVLGLGTGISTQLLF